MTTRTYPSLKAPTCLHSCCVTDEDLGRAARVVLGVVEAGGLPDLDAAVRLLADRALVAQRERLGPGDV